MTNQYSAGYEDFDGSKLPPVASDLYLELCHSMSSAFSVDR